MRGSVDLFPTLVDLAGLDSSVFDLPGQSMAAAVLGEGHIESSPFVISETDWRSVNKTAIRTEDHLLIQNDSAAAHQTDGRFEGKKLDWVEKKILANTPAVEFYAITEIPTGVGQSLAFDENSETMARALEDWKADYPIRSPIGRDAKDGTTHSDGTFVSSPFIDTSSTPPMDDDVAEQLKSLGYLGDDTEE